MRKILAAAALLAALASPAFGQSLFGGNSGSGSGSVTSISGGNGILPSTNPCTTTCTLNTTVTRNNQTGTSYAMQTTDGGKVVTGSQAGAMAYTIAQATTTGFTAGYGSTVANINAPGGTNLTLTATTSTFGNGLTSIVLAPGQVLDFASDGTNYPFTSMSLPVVANNHTLANTSGASNYPVDTTLSALIDGALGSTRGSILERGASGWTILAPSSTAGQALASNGTGADPSYQTITGGSGCTVSGTANQLVSNNGSTGCQSDAFTVTTTGVAVDPVAGAASTPALTLSGAPFTGGSGTTTFPHFYLNTTGASAVTAFSTSGTFIGINGPSGFAGNLFDFYVNGGSSVASLSATGLLNVGAINVTSGSLTPANGLSLKTANNPQLTANSTEIQQWGSTLITTFKAVQDATAGGYQINTGATSSTAPVFAPNKSSTNTGIGAQASGNWSGIVGGVEKFRVTTEGVQYKQATPPAVGGTATPTIATGSTDEAGEVTAGTTATSVTITFNLTHANAPFCVVTSQTQLVSFAYTLSNTVITITQTATTGNKIDYRCTFP